MTLIDTLQTEYLSPCPLNHRLQGMATRTPPARLIRQFVKCMQAGLTVPLKLTDFVANQCAATGQSDGWLAQHVKEDKKTLSHGVAKSSVGSKIEAVCVAGG